MQYDDIRRKTMHGLYGITSNNVGYVLNAVWYQEWNYDMQYDSINESEICSILLVWVMQCSKWGEKLGYTIKYDLNRETIGYVATKTRCHVTLLRSCLQVQILASVLPPSCQMQYNYMPDGLLSRVKLQARSASNMAYCQD